MVLPESTRILTVFGATGNQGSGVINTVLSSAHLSQKYTLRAVTRDVTSPKALALSARGVSLVCADLNDLESLKQAVRGSYGVFGMTDFWQIHSAKKEVQQGKNIFHACKAEGVKHFVYSSLPGATKMTGGVLSRLAHFDSKASVQLYVELNKGDMVTSYFMPGKNLSHLHHPNNSVYFAPLPALSWTCRLNVFKQLTNRRKPAMFLSFLPNLIRLQHGNPSLILPFPSSSSAWPLIDPPRDGGKYILGLFEAGSKANGQHVQAVSCWITPSQLVSALSKESGRDVALQIVSPEEFAKPFPDNLSTELTETLRVAGEYGVFGKGQGKEQEKYDRWLVEGAEPLVSLEEWIKENGPWTFETPGFLDQLSAQKKSQGL